MSINEKKKIIEEEVVYDGFYFKGTKKYFKYL